MTLNEAQFDFNRLAGLLEQRFAAAGVLYRLDEARRSNEQAAINAIGESGRLALAGMLEADARFHALALSLRDNGKHDGILLSVHCVGLARDYSLFRKGADGKLIYLESSEDHRPFGEWWKAQHPLARWGGDFRDGDHYSFEWGGRK